MSGQGAPRWMPAEPYEVGEYVTRLEWVPFPWWRRLLTGSRGEYVIRMYRAQ